MKHKPDEGQGNTIAPENLALLQNPRSICHLPFAISHLQFTIVPVALAPHLHQALIGPITPIGRIGPICL